MYKHVDTLDIELQKPRYKLLRQIFISFEKSSDLELVNT